MLSTVVDTLYTPQTDSASLASAEKALVYTGQRNEQSIAATLQHPLPSDLRPEGTGITISATV